MTKDCQLSLSKKQRSFDKDASITSHDQQYTNINLNQYGQTFLKAEHSVSTTTLNGGKKDYAFSKAKKAIDQLYIPSTTSNSWTKLENGLQKLSLNDPEDTGESKWKNRHESDATKGSTLSLHIAAYENAIEKAPNGTNDESGGGGESTVENKDKTMKLGKTWRNVKDVLNGSSTATAISNYFEFPRHPSKAQTSKPEVMQFRASQRLNSQAAADARRPGLLEAADELSQLCERKEISKEEFKVRLQARSRELGYQENRIYTAWRTYVHHAENHFESEGFKFDSPFYQRVAIIERRLNPQFCQAPPVLIDSRAEVSNQNRVHSLGPDEPAESGAPSNPILLEQQSVQVAAAANAGSNLMRENAEQIQGINVRFREASAAANATEQTSHSSLVNGRQQTVEGVVEDGAQVAAQQIIREPYATGFITAINQTNSAPPFSRSVTFQIPNQHQQSGGDERRQNENVQIAPSHQSNPPGPLVTRQTVRSNSAQPSFASENLNGGGNEILHQRPSAAPILPQQPSNDAAFNGIRQQQQEPVQLAADANAETPPNGANLIRENVEQTQNGTVPPMPQHVAENQNPALNQQPQPRQQPQYIFFFGNDQNLDVLRTVLSSGGGNNA